MLIGYARVKTNAQDLAIQEKALKRAGCKSVFTDIASGAKSALPGLEQALSHLSKGDILVVWKLTCLGRSLRHLISVIKDLHQNSIGFKSLQENIDTITAAGSLTMHVIDALAEFEKELVGERTQVGLKAARIRGRLGGRPYSLSKQQIDKLQQYYTKGDLSVKEICRLFNIAKPTLYRYLENNKII